MTVLTHPGSARLRPLVVLGAAAAFVIIGLQQALYGPIIPALRTAHGISAAAAAAALSVHFTGGIIGVLVMPLARRRGVPDGRFLSWSLTLIAAGCAGFAIAPGWPLALVAAFVAGVGFGGINVGVNQVFTEVYSRGGHGMLNLLHGCFGVGAAAGPIMVGLLPGYALAFVGCALLALLVAPMLRGAAGLPLTPDARPGWHSGVLGAVSVGFLVFFVLHVGLSTGAGGWETTHLISTGMTESVAAAATSGFWLAFTAARFAVVPLCRHLSARAIVIGSTGLAALAAAATLVDGAAPVAYGLLGAAVGPLFPTGLAWLAEVRPRLTPAVVALSSIGGIAAPPAIGLIVGGAGPAAIGWAMVTLAVLGLVTVLGLSRATRRAG